MPNSVREELVRNIHSLGYLIIIHNQQVNSIIINQAIDKISKIIRHYSGEIKGFVSINAIIRQQELSSEEQHCIDYYFSELKKVKELPVDYLPS